MINLLWIPKPSACLNLVFLLVLFKCCSVPAAEREADGAYSPQERRIHGNEEEHHHEAIFGNEQEHQASHKLSSDESRAKLLELAAKHDLDQDGVISTEELQKWIYQSFQDLTAEDAQNKFQDVDADGNGLATWGEHLSDTWGVPDDDNMLNSEEYKDEMVMIKEEELLFTAADRDQDGNLNREEFLAFERPEQYEYMQPLVIKRSKEARDLNGDGFIDFHEYIVALIPNYKKTLSQEEKETYISEKERFDTYFDLDKDGRLNNDEIFRWLIPDDNATAASEAEHIMEKSDSNKDGALSKEEILEHYQIFVGSEVTDYGNALSPEHADAHEEL